VKRFIDALKSENFLPEVFPSFVDAFSTLVKSNLSAEVFRTLALFITYSLHKPHTSNSRTPKSAFGSLPSRTPSTSGVVRRPTLATNFDAKPTGASFMTKRQIGIGILEMYSDLLCIKESTSNLKKFATTVTNKVCLQPGFFGYLFNSTSGY
jgi:hypothetical protein